MWTARSTAAASFLLRTRGISQRTHYPEELHLCKAIYCEIPLITLYNTSFWNWQLKRVKPFIVRDLCPKLVSRKSGKKAKYRLFSFSLQWFQNNVPHSCAFLPPDALQEITGTVCSSRIAKLQSSGSEHNCKSTLKDKEKKRERTKNHSIDIFFFLLVS